MNETPPDKLPWVLSRLRLALANRRLATVATEEAEVIGTPRRLREGPVLLAHDEAQKEFAECRGTPRLLRTDWRMAFCL